MYPFTFGNEKKRVDFLKVNEKKKNLSKADKS